ncbi:triacylglycerol lipase [Entomophthora muscae]|uniref:Triacylglycerol lipase n=1 Tax=Entomophthora muscae TaxID=34485 RepID=A0ACC2S7E1_9FUNG|nr:triacylglycerol lipase [Entomophthora muscae]
MLPQMSLLINKRSTLFMIQSYSFGTTALILHGGATFGLCHIGVVKSLFEQGLLPKVICGTEIGALIAALVCIHTDEELPNFLKPGGINLEAFSESSSSGTFSRKLERLLKTGHLLDASILERCVRSNTGDITFEEAYRRTNRVLNITVCPTRKNEVPQLLNYLTAPNVLIRSAACASAAVLGFYDSVDLLIKDKAGQIVPWNSSAIRWANGQTSEIESPMSRLSELYNVNHFIVSQASPYVVPFMSKELQLQDDRLMSRVRNVFYSEIGHRLHQLEQFRLLPRILRGVVDQKFAGHITLFPAVTLQDFNSLFSRPTPAIVDYWIEKGEQSTFPILELIRNRCCTEFTLSKIKRELKTENPNRAPHVDSIIPPRNDFKRTKSIH